MQIGICKSFHLGECLCENYYAMNFAQAKEVEHELRKNYGEL